MTTQLRQKDLAEQQIMKEVAKFIKEKIGKGPGYIDVSFGRDVVVFYIQDFMTKAEELIAKSGSPEKVSEYRSIYTHQSVDEIEEIFYRTLGRRIRHFFPSYLPDKNLACWTIFLK